MEPFSIACTTCQARLRVRDESVLGQILTCPKCGSMVLVEPTAATSEPAGDSTDATGPVNDTNTSVSSRASSVDATFEDAAAIIEETVSQPPVESPDLTETVEDLDVQARSQEERGGVSFSDYADEVAETSVDDDTSDLAPPPLPPTDEALLPNAEWSSASTVQWRNRALTAIAAVIGVVLAMLLFVVFSGDDDPPVVSAPDSPIEHSANEATVEIGTDGERETHENSDAEPNEPTAESPATKSPNEPVETQPLTEPIEQDPPVAAPSMAEEPIAPSPTDTKSEPVPSTETATTTGPPGLIPKEEPAATDDADSDSSPLSSTLRDFGALLDDEPIPMVDSPTAEPEDPVVPDDSDDPPLIVPTGPRAVVIEDRLDDPIAQVAFNSVPLTNFLQFASDYSTIPITLDADILRWARVSPDTAVNVNASDTTVAGMLEEGLKPLMLEHQVVVNQLFVTRRSTKPGGMRTVPFNVEDLVGEDSVQLQWLGDRVMDFVAPDSWSSRGGVGTMTFRGSELVIEQREVVLFSVLEFCEKLRVARGLPTRSRAYDSAMFELKTRSERAQDYLAKPITLTYLRPAPLQGIVDRIADQAEVNILIDWLALASAEWSPDAEVPYAVADQPLAKALTTLLEPMDLAFRIVDGTTIQITTPVVVQAKGELEFYRLADADRAEDDFVAIARDALGDATFRDAGGNGAIVVDEVSGCLIAYLSQPKHSELRAWLNSRRGVAARVLK